jgi:hypothetical protein
VIVYNHDIAGLYRRLNRFINELVKSESAASSQVNTFDQARLQSYLDAIRTYQSWVVGQPALDLPETHPTEYQLEDAPVVPAMENESVWDVINLLVLTREELVNGQSARMASNLNEFDNTRLTAVIDKAQAFLTSYIQPTTPLDLPESSPMRELTGPGKTGV